MKEIGIVICNYNKEEYIINCIDSVLNQTMQGDVYVVDNASTDKSVNSIRERFDGRVELIINEENIGGSGGFNTGLRKVLEQDYKYVMLMDNDIVADARAVEELYNFLEQNPDVGIAGSKVYYMDEPEKIWGYGGYIDFDSYVQKDKYKNCIDSEDIPEVSYCDYVAACSLMARADAIRKVGIMPEDNFIYWDDMEWGYRFNEAGYKVCVYGKSKIWHKGGGRNAVNTFGNYYMTRNRIRFFKKVLKMEQLPEFADTILEEIFRMIYSCHLKGEDNIVKSVMYAIDDAAHDVSGKAAEYKILPRTRSTVRVADALSGGKNVLIKFNGDLEGLGNIVRSVEKNCAGMKIAIATDNKQYEQVKQQYPGYEITVTYTPDKYDKHMIMCDHIFKITGDMPKDVYIDAWCNIIYTEKDFTYASSFEMTKDLFILCNKGLLCSAT